MPCKNLLTVNSRVEQTYRAQMSGLYRQHVTAMAILEHERLDTSRLLTAIHKCPSDTEPLSVKFLGPPKRRKGRRQQQQQQQQQPIESARPAAAALVPPHTATGLPASAAAAAAVGSERQQQPPSRLGRSKTFAGAAAVPSIGVRAASPLPRRQKTPLPAKLERFYTNLQGTKSSCGLSVIDATQTQGFRQGSYTLSRTDWLDKLARIDPEFFKNVQNGVENGELDDCLAARS